MCKSFFFASNTNAIYSVWREKSEKFDKGDRVGNNGTIQHIQQFEAFNIIFLFNEDNSEVLLLKRDPDKRYFPNYYTGVGGSIELERGEAKQLDHSMIRELEEETEIRKINLTHLNCDLITQHNRNNDGELTLLFWYSGNVIQKATRLSCTEGELAWFPLHEISELRMIDTAYFALKYIVRTNRHGKRNTTALAFIDTDEDKMVVVKER